MKTESLEALLIDRELGELTPEAVELLESWLGEHPQAATAVASVHQTVQTTKAAVRRYPELARPESNVIAFPAARFRLVPAALAASVFILLGATAWLGFQVGRQSVPGASAANRAQPPGVAASSAAHAGPWARYALASNPRGGLTVVRRDKAQ